MRVSVGGPHGVLGAFVVRVCARACASVRLHVRACACMRACLRVRLRACGTSRETKGDSVTALGLPGFPACCATAASTSSLDILFVSTIFAVFRRFCAQRTCAASPRLARSVAGG